ncbi:MAG TPA: hypothetical protein ENJ00_06905, partial [Phycisphaerales bacterium]|nr:hypothetical protein [Phycisphaerales bacterium]
ALGKARLAAQKLLGQANHRGIAQGVNFYADQFNEWLPAGHTAAGGKWAFTWPAQVRFALGGDEGAMEIFLNPGAGKEFNIEWKKIIDTSKGFSAKPTNAQQLTEWGYELGELPIRHDARGTDDPDSNGFTAFSVAWNESGAANSFLQDPRSNDPNAVLDMGLGMHVYKVEDYAAGSIRALTEFGPKLSGIQEPSNMITTTDSFVNVNDDPWVSPLSTHEEQNPGGYFSGQGNFSFLDGHVESVNVEDYTLTADNIGDVNDVQLKSRIRRWNKDGRSHTEYWE